jgi:Pilus formation protein N terminal region
MVSDMMKTLFPVVCLTTALLVAAPAWAGQVLQIEVDESQMLTLPAAPGAIIIGNPSIADVSVQGKQIFIHGRGFGQTNLTILDLQGNQIAYFSVMGKHTQESAVALYRGGSRFSYSCAPYCESELQVGDDPAYTAKLMTQSSGKIEMATGNKTAEADAPAAPQ